MGEGGGGFVAGKGLSMALINKFGGKLYKITNSVCWQMVKLKIKKIIKLSKWRQHIVLKIINIMYDYIDMTLHFIALIIAYTFSQKRFAKNKQKKCK